MPWESKAGVRPTCRSFDAYRVGRTQAPAALHSGSQNLRDRLSEIIHVLPGNPRDVDAARIHHVNAELAFQPQDLFGRDAKEREHPCTAFYVREIMLRRSLP